MPPARSAIRSRSNGRKANRSTQLPKRLVAELGIPTKAKVARNLSKAARSPGEAGEDAALRSALKGRRPLNAPEAHRRVSRPVGDVQTDTEDAEIAWLESALGLSKGEGRDKGKAKAALREDFAGDGLEDLFDDLEELEDQLIGVPPDPTLEPGGSSGPSSDSDHESQGALQSPDIDHRGQRDICTDSNDASDFDRGRYGSTEDSTSSARPARAYVPPHLRPGRNPAKRSEAAQVDPRLRRRLLGLLNRLSLSSLQSTLAEMTNVYAQAPRAEVSGALIDLLVDHIGVPEPINSTFVMTYAALIAGTSRGGVLPAGSETAWSTNVLAAVVSFILDRDPLPSSASADPPAAYGKQRANALALLSRLYLLGVVGDNLVLDCAFHLLSQTASESTLHDLLVLLEGSGNRFPRECPGQAKSIAALAKTNYEDLSAASSRSRFLLETLERWSAPQKRQIRQAANEDVPDAVAAFLNGVSKQTGVKAAPLQLRLTDLRTTRERGRWWLTGAPWSGDPLLDHAAAREGDHGAPIDAGATEHSGPASDLEALAKQQGMNTAVRRHIFAVLVASEDYVDACQRLSQLALSGTQEREIFRVLLQCLSNEAVYNPFYALVGQRLAGTSRSAQLTLQYCLWDTTRELGSATSSAELPGRHNSLARRHQALAFGWWIGKSCLPTTSLKNVPFDALPNQTILIEFISTLVASMFLASQTASPSMSRATLSKKLDQAALDRALRRVASTPSISKALQQFLQMSYSQPSGLSDRLLADAQRRALQLLPEL